MANVTPTVRALWAVGCDDQAASRCGAHARTLLCHRQRPRIRLVRAVHAGPEVLIALEPTASCSMHSAIQGTVVAVVSGMPGVGKSALASQWANSVRQEFPEGALYADFAHVPGVMHDMQGGSSQRRGIQSRRAWGVRRFGMGEVRDLLGCATAMVNAGVSPVASRICSDHSAET